MKYRLYMRRAVLADWPDVLDIQRRAYGEVKWGVFSLLLERLYLGEEYLIMDDLTPVGFAHMRRHIKQDVYTWINLCVVPEYQRQGIGRDAMLHLMRLYESRGAKVFHLSVRVDNSHAVDLYKSLGFVETGIKQNYYREDGVKVDGITMQRVLA